MMPRVVPTLVALGVAAAVSYPSLAAPAPQSAASVIAAVEKLKPGQFLWFPQLAPEGPVLVMVSLASQRAVVYRNGVPIGVSTVSSGKKGHETPTGVFTILQRKVDHKSNLYNNAPMPYMQRLTWDGIALHAGTLPGHPASHGCIRLPLEFARQLFGVTKLGITVVVTDDRALPRVAPSPGPLTSAAPITAAGQQAGAAPGSAARWQPELSPEGPVSIIVSAADGRVVVLRNGREIGSAPVRFASPVRGTFAYTLQGVTSEGPQWVRLPMPGVPATADTQLAGAIEVDAAFRNSVIAVLRPGATVIVTADSLRAGAGTSPVRLELAEPHD